MRRSLYLKDDDYRLSFLYGNFTTLTRFTEADLERVVTERLGPLYVSIHATDPELRARLLRNRRRRHQPALARGAARRRHRGARPGRRVPGRQRRRRARRHAARHPRPVPRARDGRRRPARRERPHHRARHAAPHAAPRRERVLDIVERVAGSASSPRSGRRLVYASDEYYLLAGRPFPTLDALRRAPAARERHRHGRARSRPRCGARSRATPVDGHGHPRRLLRLGRRRPGRGLPRAADRSHRSSTPAPASVSGRDDRPRSAHGPVTLLTGEYGAAGARAAAPTSSPRPRGAPVACVPVANRFFGGNIAVTGLLTGADVAARRSTPRRRRGSLLLPDVVLSNGRFLDGTTPDDLPRPVEVVATDGASLVAALRSRVTIDRAALPVVAVVGRPNVGKSTLVNRFVGRRDAIVEEQPGVTRDRKELEAEWNGRVHRRRHRRLARPMGDGAEPLARRSASQAERAIADADVILLVVDVTVGITEEDAQVARILQRRASRCSLVANKVDDERREADIWAFAALGLGDPHPVLGDPRPGERRPARRARRRAAASPETPEPEPTRGRRRIFSVAIVGRPNVGKSTLFNRLVGDERSVVHDLPGTTRDSIDTIVETEDGPLRFVDTAGMRRRSRIDEPTEYFSLVRALQAVDRADAALLVIDAARGRDATRTSGSPSGSTPPAPRSSSCSTSGTCSTPRTARRPRSTSPTGSRSSATRRCSRSRRSPAR